MMIKYKKQIFWIGLLVAFLWWIQSSDFFFHPQSAEDVRKWVTSFGALGALVYVGLYIVRPFLLIPSIFFNLSAGILFGPYLGILYLLLGGIGSAWAFFFLGRLGHNKTSLLQRFGGKLGKRIDNYLSSNNSFMRMLWLRLVPIFPYDPVSLVAGCSSMKVGTFTGATLVGMLPGAIAYNFFSSFFVDGYNVWLGVILLVVAFGIPLFWWYASGEKKAF